MDDEATVRERNKAAALAFMEAMSTNRADLADAVLAPGACAVAMGFGKFAGVRPRETMVGALDLFRQILPTGLRLDIGSVTAEGDRVVVEARGNGVTADGTPYANHYCFVLTLADGLITRVNEYFCNIHADAVLWPLASAAGGLEATAN